MSDESTATRTSGLAVFCLLFGLMAAGTALTAAWGVWVMKHASILMPPTRLAYEIGYIASIIVAASAAVPALVAIILWIAARASVRESGGAVRGVALYRTGMLLVVLSVLGAVAGSSSVLGASKRGLAEARALYPGEDPVRQAEAYHLKWRFQSMLEDRHRGSDESFAGRFMEDIRAEARGPVAIRILKGDRLGSLVYEEHIRLFTVEQARKDLKGVGRFDEVLARTALQPDDILAVVPIRDAGGLQRADIARFFLVGVEGEDEYVYYVFRKRDREWKAMYLGDRTGPPREGGSTRPVASEYCCPMSGCFSRSSEPGTCPSHEVPLKLRRR